MHRRIFTLVAACFLPVASVALADDKVVPQSASKEATALSTAIEQRAAEHFSSDAIKAQKSQEKQIRLVFGKLVKEYGVKNRLEIAEAVATQVPAEFHGYVAKRALAYSPVKAKEILAALSNNGANASVSSALSTLPTVSASTLDAAGAIGVSLDQADRVFQLPQASSLRRYVKSIPCFPGDGGPEDGNGTIDPGGGDPLEPVFFNLQPVNDNRFTPDGLAYVVIRDLGGPTEEFLGEYLVFAEPDANTIILSQKNQRLGGVNGSGAGQLTITITP